MSFFLVVEILMWVMSLMVLNHPVILVIYVVFFSLLITMMLYVSFKLSWFMLIFLLMILGGLMVLFMYMASLASNEKFSVSFSWIWIVSLFSLFYLNNRESNLKFEGSYLSIMSLMFTSGDLLMIVGMIIYLFISLVLVLEIILINKAPFRIYM